MRDAVPSHLSLPHAKSSQMATRLLEERERRQELRRSFQVISSPSLGFEFHTGPVPK